MIMIAVWLSASWPCVHVAAFDIHGHDRASGMELTAAAGHACDCHSCEEIPCYDQTVDVVQRLTSGGHAGLRPSQIPLFILSDSRPARPPLLSDNAGPLRALQTVRLLI